MKCVCIRKTDPKIHILLFSLCTLSVFKGSFFYCTYTLENILILNSMFFIFAIVFPNNTACSIINTVVGKCTEYVIIIDNLSLKSIVKENRIKLLLHLLFIFLKINISKEQIQKNIASFIITQITFTFFKLDNEKMVYLTPILIDSPKNFFFNFI